MTGWIMNACCVGSLALTSSSEKCGTRAPVSASMRRVGDVAMTEIAMVSGVGRPVTVALGMCVRMVLPGEKPSRVVNCWLVMRTFCEDRGSVVVPK